MPSSPFLTFTTVVQKLERELISSPQESEVSKNVKNILLTNWSAFFLIESVSSKTSLFSAPNAILAKTLEQ